MKSSKICYKQYQIERKKNGPGESLTPVFSLQTKNNRRYKTGPYAIITTGQLFFLLSLTSLATATNKEFNFVFVVYPIVILQKH